VKYQADGTAIFPLGGFQWYEGQLKTVYPFDRSGGYKVKVAPPWDKKVERIRAARGTKHPPRCG